MPVASGNPTPIFKWMALILAMACGLLATADLPAQGKAGEPLNEEVFAEESLRYRTALHYDPLLDGPLDALVKLYVGAERADELIGLYRSHVEQYPEDAGAKTVLVRLLRRIDKSGADEVIASSVPLHPDYAPLQFVLFRFLEERGDPRAAEALSRAIDLEANPTRRNEWLDQLLRLTEGKAARGLAEGQFAKLLSPPDLSVEDLLELARLMQRYRFWAASLPALKRAEAAKPDPETAVEITILTAKALNETGDRAGAGKALDGLLSRLATDHWRRREILSLRFEVVATPEERAALLGVLEKSYRDFPDREAAVLDYAEALAAAERRNDALSVLTEASSRLPKSALIEARVLEALESSGDLDRYAGFLNERVERDPSRLDLRFRLVKVQYALNRDADAEQDFKTVIAGLTPEEASVRILELQRYLRGIKRIDAAVGYLESYVRNHPSRLDVARELVEIYVAEKRATAIGQLVRQINPEEAEAENVLDLAGFLLENQQASAARVVVEGRLRVDPKKFELGLMLIEVLGRVGDVSGVTQQIGAFRDLADTAPRYQSWLEASVSAHRQLETLPGFFDSELNRYQFDDSAWNEDKVERFLILCETGKRQFLSGRVAEGVRKQLAMPGLDPALKLRMRKVLVSVIESDPVLAAETEEQLRLLASEDPAHRSNYDLRRALVYDRGQRVDLSQALIPEIDLSDVDDPTLLRDAVDLLIRYGYLREAETALAAIIRLEPGDLLSWERRLSVLVMLGQESALRALLRSLRSGESGGVLRESSNLALDAHIDASYWRSIAAIFRDGSSRLGEVLPLLASAERETPEISPLWIEWVRTYALTAMGQTAEAEEALERFHRIAADEKVATVDFPDGMRLSVDAATAWLSTTALETLPGGDDARPEQLLSRPELRWAFELPQESSVLRMGRNESQVVLLDDSSELWVLDAASGKLLWRAPLHPGRRAGTGLPRAFKEAPQPPSLYEKPGSPPPGLDLAPDLIVSGDRFFASRGDEIVAFAAADGSILWNARLGGSEVAQGNGKTEARTFRLALGTNHLVAFDRSSGDLHAFFPDSGKLAWSLPLGSGTRGNASPDRSSRALQSGLSVSGRIAFIYGFDSVIVDLDSGQIVWRLGGAPAAEFPLVLRPFREEEDAEVFPAAPPASATASSPKGTEVAFSTRLDASREAPDILDFQSISSRPPGSAASIPEGPFALVTPGQHWTKFLGDDFSPALGILSPNTLWLMQGDRVRRISSQLPVASRELQASGVFLGRVRNHAWFLDVASLVHADFSGDRVTRLSLHDLGDPRSIRVTLSGNLLLVRGESGLKLINGLNGEVIGQGPLPEALVDYLAGFPGELPPPLPDTPVVPGTLPSHELVWQGRVQRNRMHSPGLLVPVSDLLWGSQYTTLFGKRFVVCLNAPDDGSPLPPAPDLR